MENNGGASCEAYKAIFSHVAGSIQRILDEEPDLDEFNPFVKEAVISKLINPKTVSH